MLVSHFHFDLPHELIATVPANPRDSAKLLSVSDKIEDFSVSDLPSFLRAGDVMVFNDTKVIPARLFGFIENNKLPSKAQVTLHKQDSPFTWRAFAKPARKFKVDGVFKISDDFYADILAKNEGEVTLQFNVSGDRLFLMLDEYGVPPLPPYIERAEKKPTSDDTENYQTIYAKNKGAVAAPTAGLHFTDSLLQDLDNRGVIREFVTLHVCAGTFLPMKVENTEDHILPSE